MMKKFLAKLRRKKKTIVHWKPLLANPVDGKPGVAYTESALTRTQKAELKEKWESLNESHIGDVPEMDIELES